MNMIVGKKQLVLASLVVALGVAVYLNYQFAGEDLDLVTANAQQTTQELSTEEGAASFSRVANLGGKQLQARMVTEYYGLELDDIIDGVTVLE